MKSEAEVSTRVRELLLAELRSRIDEATRKLPTSCRFNHRHPLDERRFVDGVPNPAYNQITAAKGRTIGLCMYGAEDPTQWPGTICEDEVDAMCCPYFTPVRSEAAVVEEFQRLIKDASWLQANLPGVYELRWVLDGEVGIAASLEGAATVVASLETSVVHRVTALVEARVENTPAPGLFVPFKLTLWRWLQKVWRAIVGSNGVHSS